MCASPVVVGRACARCGAGAEGEARFCARCGLDLGAPPPPVAPLPGPAPAITARPAPLLPAEPSSIGRRASSRGWLVVIGGAALLLAGSVGVIAVTGRGASPGAPPGASPATAPGLPPARFDEMLSHGSTVAAGAPFEIEVEAVNPAAAATDRLWLVIEWRPADLPATHGARGSLVACEPAGCDSREDPAAERTVVSWPGLAPGARRVLRLTVAAEGLVPGTTFWSRVRSGSGADETVMGGGYVWDLDLEVE
jgi:hypothetical protein